MLDEGTTNIQCEFPGGCLAAAVGALKGSMVDWQSLRFGWHPFGAMPEDEILHIGWYCLEHGLVTLANISDNTEQMVRQHEAITQRGAQLT